ncbi:MAG: hypothetical protein Q8M73_08595 [Actinomycetota bacterium]|nr:hypothetical protein [Actinomycetota bacterium]
MNEVTGFTPTHDREDAEVGNEFLTASVDAAKDLESAQARHAQLVHRSDQKLEAAQSRRDAEVASARQVEARAWKRLMSVPGMTAATAARIGNSTSNKVNEWIALADSDIESCN